MTDEPVYPTVQTRAEVYNEALEHAAMYLEQKQTNSLYAAAWRAGAKLIRTLKKH